jgi:predicted ATP-dependent Lon-type protease
MVRSKRRLLEVVRSEHNISSKYSEANDNKTAKKSVLFIGKDIVRTAYIYTRKPAIRIFTPEAVKKHPFLHPHSYIPGFKFSKILKNHILLAIHL